MPIYEVTAKVPSNIQAQWLEYMQKHVKDLIETKCFDGAAMRRVKDTPEISYVISYFYTSDQSFESMWCHYLTFVKCILEYQQQYQSQLQQDHRDHFSNVQATRRILDDPLIEINADV